MNMRLQVMELETERGDPGDQKPTLQTKTAEMRRSIQKLKKQQEAQAIEQARI